MYNVLHVIGYIGRGGDTSVVLDVMNNMDSNKYHFDFITHKGTTDMNVVKRLRDSGSTVYILEGDVRILGIKKYYQEIKKIIESSQIKYNAIHTHTSMQSGVALLAAKKAGINKRICHSHVTTIQRKASALKRIIAVPIFRFLYMKNSTCKVACSKMAGDFLFGNNNNYTLIYNAVDVNKYLDVSEKDIADIRNEFGINDDDIVIGHVGRMSSMKNQEFDILLAEHTKNNPNIKYVLVGDGTDLGKIKELAVSLSKTVVITGQRYDVPAIMKSCDCVILPSLPGEGFPVTMIEAQAAGCKCIVSDTVTPEVEIGLGLVDIISIDKIDEWVNSIKRIKRNKDIDYRNKCAQQLSEKGFGKDVFVSKWLELYDG